MAEADAEHRACAQHPSNRFDRLAELCWVAKGHLFDPYFVRHAARKLGYDLNWPNQYPAATVFNPEPKEVR